MFWSILTNQAPPLRTFCRHRTGIRWKWNDLVLQSAAALRDSVMMVLLYISGPWPVHQPIRKQSGLYQPIREKETHAPPIHQWSVAALSELTSWIHNRGHQAAATSPLSMTRRGQMFAQVQLQIQSYALQGKCNNNKNKNTPSHCQWWEEAKCLTPHMHSKYNKR